MPRHMTRTFFNQDPQRIGWLLACTAPKNIEKGERLLADLDANDQRRGQAIFHARRLVALYVREGGESCREHYVDHAYYEMSDDPK